MNGSAWNPEADERLRAMWRAGEGRFVIAAAFGRSYKAISARAHRLGLGRYRSDDAMKAPVAPVLERVSRDPCQRCGVRSDLGCKHMDQRA